MACGVWDQDIDILAVFHRDVPPQVSRKDFRAAARSANYLQISRVPTNLAEYLGVSVPGMNNADANADACIGNISNIIGREKIQGVLPEFNCGVDACVRLLSVCDA